MSRKQNTSNHKNHMNQYNMSMVLDTRKCNFGSQKWLWFHIWFIITFYYKVRPTLLQIATVILLQNATKACRKMRELFYN